MKQSLYAGAASLAVAATVGLRSGQKDGNDPSNDVSEKIDALGKAIAEKVDNLKSDQDKLEKETGEREKKFDQFKSDIDEKLTELTGLKDQMKELEQKLARGGNADPEQAKSIGQKFVDSDGFKGRCQHACGGPTRSARWPIRLI